MYVNCEYVICYVWYIYIYVLEKNVVDDEDDEDAGKTFNGNRVIWKCWGKKTSENASDKKKRGERTVAGVWKSSIAIYSVHVG